MNKTLFHILGYHVLASALAFAQVTFADSLRALNCTHTLSVPNHKSTSKSQINGSNWLGNPDSVNWYDDLSIGKSLKANAAVGVMRTFYDSQFKTRFYFTASAAPTEKAEMPIVDPNAKALYIFFHGSGTMKSSGKNYAAQMNELSRLGFASLSFDLPYHGDGPIGNRFEDPKYFMKWIHEIITKYRRPGQPVYLVGHSFGPDVAAEYTARYPFSVNGAVLLSPAGFDRVLQKWYIQHTQHMKFGGDVPVNTAAGAWADVVSKRFLWSDPRNGVDPTKVNPSLAIRVLSGDHEEYVPAPTGGKNKTPIGKNTYDITRSIKARLSGAHVTIEPNVGHYLFDFKDQNGVNVVLRELLAVAGYSPHDIKSLEASAGKQTSLSAAQVLRKKYLLDDVFRAWAELFFKGNFLKAVIDDNETVNKQLMLTYELQNKARMNFISELLSKSNLINEEFYKQNLALIEAQDLGSLLFPFVDVLENYLAHNPDVFHVTHTEDEIQNILSIRPISRKDR